MPRDQVEELKAEVEHLRARIKGLEGSLAFGGGDRLRALLDVTPCIVCFMDGQGRIVETNRAYLDAFGLASEQCLGRTHQDLAGEPGCDEALFNRAHRWEQRAWDEARPVMCEEIVSESGQDQILEMVRTPIMDQDGQRLGMVLVGQDITDRVKREFDSQILVTEQTAIFENAFVGIAFTRDNRVARVNTTLESMTGFTGEELERLGLQALLPGPDGYDALLDLALPDLLSGEAFVAEKEITRKDGTSFFARLGGKAVGQANMMRGVVWLIEDIDERKRVERLREDTERIVRHDLKSPLNAIVGCADVLAQDVEDQDLARMADMILHSGYKMLRMIEHSLDLFKMEEGQYALNPAPVDLVALFRDLEPEFSTLTRINRLQVLYFLDNEPPGPDSSLMVMGERPHLESLFANLVKNALEAAPTDSEVTVRMAHGRPGATVEVHNPGQVPEDMRHRLFTRYATSGKSKGSGLGTYSARLIARVHGGEVALTDSGPNGTTFTVTLPACP